MENEIKEVENKVIEPEVVNAENKETEEIAESVRILEKGEMAIIGGLLVGVGVVVGICAKKAYNFGKAKIKDVKDKHDQKKLKKLQAKAEAKETVETEVVEGSDDTKE